MSMENYHGRCPNEKTFPHFINSLFKAEGGTNSVNRKCNPLRRSCVSSARNAGESAIGAVRAQPSAEIVRVECAKCRRECDSPAARATLCGEIVRVECAKCRRECDRRDCRLRAQPSAEIVRVECAKCRRECDWCGARATLCGSCVSSARNAGESAICRLRAQPSAEIMRVEYAKCRRECDLPAARATLCERGGVCARATLMRRSGVSSARKAGERCTL